MLKEVPRLSFNNCSRFLSVTTVGTYVSCPLPSASSPSLGQACGLQVKARVPPELTHEVVSPLSHAIRWGKGRGGGLDLTAHTHEKTHNTCTQAQVVGRLATAKDRKVFCRRWRRHLLDTMHPQHLSFHWVANSRVHSAYKAPPPSQPPPIYSLALFLSRYLQLSSCFMLARSIATRCTGH